jgi:hypothetical protein
VRPRRREAVLQSDAPGSRIVVEEVIERALERWVAEVVAGEAQRRVGQAVVLDRPVGCSLALEALVVEILVKVQQRDDGSSAFQMTPTRTALKPLAARNAASSSPKPLTEG